MKILMLTFLVLITIAGYSQSSIKRPSTTVANLTDSMVMQQEWLKYSDSLQAKTSVKEFIAWFYRNLSKQEYDENFAKTFGPYYNVWYNKQYIDWLSKRKKIK